MSSHSTESRVVYKSLDFLGYPMYRVGNDGSVWSQRRKGYWDERIGPWWQLKAGRNTGNYLSVSLHSGGKAIGKTFNVHILVLLAFVGPKPDDAVECRHLDGCRTNNNLNNLCWGTYEQQVADKKRHGTISRGKKHGLKMRGVLHWAAKLTEADVREVRRLHATGEYTLAMLAAQFQISIATVHNIAKRNIWTHI